MTKFLCGNFNKKGLFTSSHIILLFALFAVIIAMLLLTVYCFKKSVRLQLKILSIVALVGEVLKIWVSYRMGIASWNNILPIYFCSLFLYASVFSAFCKNKHLRLIGDSCLMAGIVGGFFGILYAPALSYFPILHFRSIHTLLFHAIMIYAGVLVLVTGEYVPHIKHIFYFMSVMLVLSIASVIVNHYIGSNYMYINIPAINAPTYKLVEWFGEGVYPFIIVLGQLTLPYLLMQGIYNGIIYVISKIPVHPSSAIESEMESSQKSN